MSNRDNAIALEMKPISAHRVAAAYPLGRTELASVGDRAGAYLLDALFLTVSGVGLVMMGVVDNWLLLIVGAHLYFLISELAFRKSLGKRILGLEVVDADRNRASAGRIIVRALLRPVDDLLWGAAGLLSMAVSDDNQRIGDRVAGTVVLKKI